MATKHRQLSSNDMRLPSAEDMRIGIVVSEWNSDVTESLLKGAVKTLHKAGCADHDIVIKYVPGTFELALGAQFMAEYADVDGVIVLGCVVQGETRHFDFVCQGVTHGVTKLMLEMNIPVAFGVLTTENMEQALDRAGGKYGNKGEEAAATVLKMVALQWDMEDAMQDSDINVN